MARFTKDFPERPMNQLNMRVTPQTANAFRAFCSEHSLTQNEALSTLLLSQIHSGRDSAQNAYIEEIHRYQTTISDLSRKYEELLNTQKNKEESDWQKARDWAAVIREMLNYIVERTSLGKSKMKRNYFQRDHNLVNFRQYHYPTGSGCEVVRLDNLLYSRGRSPALFVLVHRVNQDGNTEFLKFRWYPRSRFVGFPPSSTKYSHPDALWVIGYMPAPDGAAEIIAALPLDGIVESSVLREVLKYEKRLTGVDAIIEDAEKRRNLQNNPRKNECFCV